jgi:hypothetical protein
LSWYTHPNGRAPLESPIVRIFRDFSFPEGFENVVIFEEIAIKANSTGNL